MTHGHGRVSIFLRDNHHNISSGFLQERLQVYQKPTVLLFEKNYISVSFLQSYFWYYTGNTSFGSHFPIKNLILETLLPLKVSNKPPWDEYENFLEPQDTLHYTGLGGS